MFTAIIMPTSVEPVDLTCDLLVKVLYTIVLHFLTLSLFSVIVYKPFPPSPSQRSLPAPRYTNATHSWTNLSPAQVLILY